MNDMSKVIVPKSDQLNSDDLMAGPRTITITGVDIREGTEQPVSVHYEGEEGRPWKPCKSMSRLLVAAWGPDASKYTGKSVTLYRDPKVKWAGMEVGGIRVSHMSDIPPEKISNGRMVVQLTETRGKRSPCVVQPLTESPANRPKSQDGAAKWAGDFISLVAGCDDMETLETLAGKKAKKLAELEKARPELHADCVASIDRKKASFGEDNSDDWADDEDEVSEAIDAGDPIAALREQIAAAETRAAYTAANKEFERISGTMSDDEFAEINQQLVDLQKRTREG